MGSTRVEKEDNSLFQNRVMCATTSYFIFHYLSKIVTFLLDECLIVYLFSTFICKSPPQLSGRL